MATKHPKIKGRPKIQPAGSIIRCHNPLELEVKSSLPDLLEAASRELVIEPRTDLALRAIRRLLRAARLSEKRLAAETGLTPSQLVVLQEVARDGETTAGAIAAAVQFSQATVTSIVDRLTERGFVVRSRRETDRRQVWVTATGEGALALSSAPDMMQDQFQNRFEQLPDWEQAMIVAMLERLTALLDADQIDAAPVIFAGAIDRISPAE